MTDEDYTRQAIEVAKESARQYKHPVGAVLVKSGQVVAKGLSKDHNFHAELNCVHEALKTPRHVRADWLHSIRHTRTMHDVFWRGIVC